MKGRFFIFLASFILTTTSEAQNPEVDKYANEDLSSFIPKGFIIANTVCADLNVDGIPDRLLVLVTDYDPDNNSNELDSVANKRSDTSMTWLYRPVLILIRQKNGKLTQLKKSNDIIQAELVGGGPFNGVEPFGGANASTGSFSLVFSARGGGQDCDETVTFKYNKKAKDWLLESIVDMCSDVNPDGEEPYWGPRKEVGRKTIKDFGKVSFSEYNYDKAY